MNGKRYCNINMNWPARNVLPSGYFVINFTALWQPASCGIGLFGLYSLK